MNDLIKVLKMNVWLPEIIYRPYPYIVLILSIITILAATSLNFGVFFIFVTGLMMYFIHYSGKNITERRAYA